MWSIFLVRCNGMHGLPADSSVRAPTFIFSITTNYLKSTKRSYQCDSGNAFWGNCTPGNWFFFFFDTQRLPTLTSIIVNETHALNMQKWKKDGKYVKQSQLVTPCHHPILGQECCPFVNAAGLLPPSIHDGQPSGQLIFSSYKQRGPTTRKKTWWNGMISKPSLCMLLGQRMCRQFAASGVS